LLLHELDERVDDIESFLATRAPETDLPDLRTELMREYRYKDEGKWLQIQDQRGNWIYCSNRGAVADPIPPLPPSPGKLFAFRPNGWHSLRMISREIHARQQTYSVAAAISADGSAIILRKFRRDLWLLVPLVALAAAVAGHFLSRKALDPVADIVAEARRINDRNLTARLPAIHTRDELSELSDTLNQMLERIEIAFRSVRSLTANASHELRTPLSLIRTRVEIALCFPRTAEHYRTVLEEVQAETIRMTALIENLLALARYDAGAAQPELRPIEMTTLIRQALGEWMPTAERQSLDLQMVGDPQPVWVLGNADSITRMFRMLMDNACRYTLSGGWIRVSVRADEGRVALAVEDSGIGIPEQDLPLIFERFYRVQQPKHREQRGSGLGLSLAKWIADQHKATITVTSTLGMGSRFRVSFTQHVPATQVASPLPQHS
jgi:two-component system, OmpR family, heavy metal sensor histidine kinase CusS